MVAPPVELVSVIDEPPTIAPATGVALGVATWPSKVYSASNISLLSIFVLVAMALMVTDEVMLIGAVYAVLAAVGSEPSMV